MARGKKEETKEKKYLFEETVDGITAQAFWKNDNTEGACYGMVFLKFDCGLSIKASLLDGKNGAFFSLPQNKGKDEKYYSQVLTTKELGEKLNTLADKCAERF